ncbi:glycerol kinase [Colletotrichum tamarilloi]|uniref:glycerol kinase n=1 Tax=Colletotrichum tamarilloi TaxID=1209934 RepID=A0ABQ9R9F0_9PEZI|nr:glycerol kinase [Colletotrichum tamarilloi]KAK1498553.1 glycerol kinase [Colletotrichum tamarilloi]
MHPQILSRVLKTPQSLPRISPFLGPVVSGTSEPADKFFSPSPRTRTKPLRPWTAHRRCIHGRRGESDAGENGIVSTGYYTCKTVRRTPQQQRELRARPKPLNSSSNQRPTPASDIMPSAGAKLQLGPPLLQHMSVRNLSSQRRATQTTKTTLGNNATAEANNGNGVRAAGIDARASPDEQSTKNTSSQSKSQSPAVRTTTTNTTNQPPRGTAYLARHSGGTDNTMAETRETKRPRVAADPAEHLPAGITETQEELKEHWFVGSIDQGTTSTRFLIFNGLGDPVASHQIEFENHYPHSGWHEHDPLELLSSVEECVEKAMAQFAEQGYSAANIRGVGITNQRETTVLWDVRTGEPLHHAVVWPDTRTTSLVRELRARPGADALQDLCGLPLSTYPSSVKLRWLLDNVPSVREAYDAGHLAFGTVDSWLIYRLNGGADKGDDAIHVTDSTNASRTMFMNLRTLKYDDTLLSFFGIDQSKIHLPKIVPSSDPTAFGSFARGVLKGVPIAGCLGDQSSALVGQCGFSPGQAKNTYGTGCFLLYNVGEEPVISKSGLLATVAYDFGKGRKPVYALEGSIAVAGSGVKFLVKNLSFVEDSSRISELAETVPDNGGVVFVTAFSGLFAPYWIDDAKGTLFGITAHTQKGHIARATLEATCYQTKAILDAMANDSGHALENLAVDGGLSNSDLCMQSQADISGIRVDRPAMRETTALGAAIAAGLALGVWDELEDLKHVNQNGRKIFTPALDRETSQKMFKKWEQAVEMSRGWVRDNAE